MLFKNCRCDSELFGNYAHVFEKKLGATGGGGDCHQFCILQGHRCSTTVGNKFVSSLWGYLQKHVRSSLQHRSPRDGIFQVYTHPFAVPRARTVQKHEGAKYT